MTRKTVNVVFYRTANFREPVKEWLLKLDKDDRSVIGTDLKTVEYGWPLGMPLVRGFSGKGERSKEESCLNGSKKMTQHKHVGSSLDDLLEADGTLEQVEAEALKRVIVWQIQQAMGQTGVNKSQLAQKMHTSRTVVNRLLDEKDTGVTITTLVKAGRALGMTWTLQAGEDNGSPRAA